MTATATKLVVEERVRAAIMAAEDAKCVDRTKWLDKQNFG
jgi:hypothetical protein